MGQDGATCFNTLSDDTRDIPKPIWDDERFGMICSSANTFAEWKKAIQKLCSMSKRCSFEAKKKIKSFGNKLEDFELRLDE